MFISPQCSYTGVGSGERMPCVSASMDEVPPDRFRQSHAGLEAVGTCDLPSQNWHMFFFRNDHALPQCRAKSQHHDRDTY